MIREEAIKLLQIHERARQGRLRAKLMLDIRSSEKQSEMKKTKETVKEEEESSVSLVTAAVRIQKLWRGYITRKYAQRKREEELIFIGMVSTQYLHNLLSTDISFFLDAPSGLFHLLPTQTRPDISLQTGATGFANLKAAC